MAFLACLCLLGTPTSSIKGRIRVWICGVISGVHKGCWKCTTIAIVMFYIIIKVKILASIQV